MKLLPTSTNQKSGKNGRNVLDTCNLSDLQFLKMFEDIYGLTVKSVVVKYSNDITFGKTNLKHTLLNYFLFVISKGRIIYKVYM